MKQGILNFIFFIFIGLILPLSINAQEDSLIIVGNEISVPSELNMNQLKSVLKGEKLRWNNGTKAVLALMKTSTPVGTYMCNKIYNMTGNELNKYFLALVFQGKAKAPTFFNSVEELEVYVAKTPGAIGVLQNTDDKLLKVILVDGKNQL